MFAETITLGNELANAMETDAPQSELDKLQDRNESLNKRFEALNLSTAEKRDLLARHKAELIPASQRL
jgi:hypothetical protein